MRYSTKLSDLLSRKRKSKSCNERGVSVPEIAITIGTLGVLATLSAPAFTMGTNSLNDSMTLIEGNFKLARSKAMSQTKAFRVVPSGSDKFVLESHENNAGTNIYSCDDSKLDKDSNNNKIWKQANGFNADEDMKLKQGVRIKSITINGKEISNLQNWDLCFDARGMANKNMVMVLEEANSGKTKSLEVFSGGSLVAYDSARFKQTASDENEETLECKSQGYTASGNIKSCVDTSNNSNTSNNPSTPTTPSLEPPAFVPTTERPTKLHCNKGGGNGSEGCDPGNHPELGNDDEGTSGIKQLRENGKNKEVGGITARVMEWEREITVPDPKPNNPTNTKKEKIKTTLVQVPSIEVGKEFYAYEFKNQGQCQQVLLKDVCKDIF